MENMTTPAVNGSGVGVHAGHDWFQIKKSINIMSVVIYSLVLMLGVLGNGVVIWATGFRMKKTVSTVWYLNLAVADFLVTAFLPLGITTRALGHWPFGWFICMIDIIVFYINMHASIFILVVISVDRCVCVVCPVWTQNHRTVRKASWLSFGVWVLALALSSPYVLFKDFSGVLCWDYPDLPMVVTNSVVGFVVPFAVIFFCYSIIINRLRNNHSLASQSCRSFKIIAPVIAVFFLCWAPYHIIWLIFAVNHPVSTESTLNLVIQFGIPITYALALLNSCVNPLLYVFMGQGFKDVFRSRSILKVLEKAFAEETCQTDSTSIDPAATRPMIALSKIKGSTGPPGTKHPSP